MKTQTTIKMIAINVLLLIAISAMAQTYYYNDTKTFYENGYTYQCDVDKATARVTLYNKENKYTYERLVFKNGIDANGAILAGMKPLEDDNWTRKKCLSIANQFFSDEEMERVKGREYSIKMIIDSSTGKVIEVVFNFLYLNPPATVSVSTYRKIEQELKSKIWFTPTADGKRMKFIMRGWRHEVEKPDTKTNNSPKILPILDSGLVPIE